MPPSPPRPVFATWPALLAAAAFGVAVTIALVVYDPWALPTPRPAHRTVAAIPLKKPISPLAVVVTPPVATGALVFALESAMSPKDLMARWDPLIGRAARRFAVPPAWIRAVMRMESGGRTMLTPDKPIISSAGAMGIMQVMPQTYGLMRARYGLGKDPYNPEDNVMAGTATLALLHKGYGYPMMFAAYNDGPAMLAAHDRANQPWPLETVNYVAGITAILSGGVPGRAGGALARLTRPDGTAVMIDCAAVMSVRAALPGEYAPGVQSVVAIQKMRQGVRESLAAARAIIRSHGGRV